MAQTRHAGNLLAIAETFLLADGIYHEPVFNRIGQQSLQNSLALQRPDGAFAVDGRADAGQQALGLMRLEEVAQYFPAPMLDDAVSRAARWLANHVNRRGEVRVGWESPGVAVQRDVAIALAYVGEARADPGLRQAAERAFQCWRGLRDRPGAASRARDVLWPLDIARSR